MCQLIELERVMSKVSTDSLECKTHISLSKYEYKIISTMGQAIAFINLESEKWQPSIKGGERKYAEKIW